MAEQLLRRDIRKQLRNPRRWWRLPRDLLVILILGSLLSIGMKAFLVRSYFIPSESMVPTLHVDDRILVDVLTPQFSGYHRGDIVVFRDPGGWMERKSYSPSPLEVIGLAPETGSYLIKRIIGLPGDTVQGKTDGSVFVNGKRVNEPYAQVTAQQPFSTTLKAGQLWVEGDNRGNSGDSRFHGAISTDDIVGRTFWVTWPLNSFGPPKG